MLARLLAALCACLLLASCGNKEDDYDADFSGWRLQENASGGGACSGKVVDDWNGAARGCRYARTIEANLTCRNGLEGLLAKYPNLNCQARMVKYTSLNDSPFKPAEDTMLTAATLREQIGAINKSFGSPNIEPCTAAMVEDWLSTARTCRWLTDVSSKVLCRNRMENMAAKYPNLNCFTSKVSSGDPAKLGGEVILNSATILKQLELVTESLGAGATGI